FLAGLARVLSVRLAGGDVYPPSSSHRADPLGTRALHDALERLHGLSVSRNHSPLPRLEAAAGPAPPLPRAPCHARPAHAEPGGLALRSFASRGGRVVMGLSGEELRTILVPRPRPTPTPRPSRKAKPTPAATPTPTPTPVAEVRTRPLLESWGLRIVTHPR